MDDGTALLIAGPTASGKSELAIRAAERLGGVVINADALAVYRDLSILTGRPDAADLARAPHRLYGHVDGAAAHSVGRWLAEAEAEIRAAQAAGAVPIVVGGTGLYLKVLTQGLSDIPAVPEEVRRQVRAEAEGVPPSALHARLAAVDSLTASRLRATDPQRILRALEVHAATGQPLALFQGRRLAPVLPMTMARGVLLDPPREALHRKIDARFDRMMALGGLAEVATLRGRELDRTLPVMRALGVPPLLDHLDGAVSLQDAVSRSKAETRAFAKRQATFARHQLDAFVRLERPDDAFD